MVSNDRETVKIDIKNRNLTTVSISVRCTFSFHIHYWFFILFFIFNIKSDTFAKSKDSHVYRISLRAFIMSISVCVVLCSRATLSCWKVDSIDVVANCVRCGVLISQNITLHNYMIFHPQQWKCHQSMNIICVCLCACIRTDGTLDRLSQIFAFWLQTS